MSQSHMNDIYNQAVDEIGVLREPIYGALDAMNGSLVINVEGKGRNIHLKGAFVNLF